MFATCQAWERLPLVRCPFAHYSIWQCRIYRRRSDPGTLVGASRQARSFCHISSPQRKSWQCLDLHQILMEETTLCMCWMLFAATAGTASNGIREALEIFIASSEDESWIAPQPPVPSGKMHNDPCLNPQAPHRGSCGDYRNVLRPWSKTALCWTCPSRTKMPSTMRTDGVW